MALLAESLVDEWLNRQGFFTIRGLRQGNDEIDLLAVRVHKTGKPTAWHVEVQASFRPVGYISQLTKDIQKASGRSGNNAAKRSDEELQTCVAAWVEKKYSDAQKKKVRESLWPDLSWKYMLVHGVLRHPEELDFIKREGVELKPLSEVLADLCSDIRPAYTAGAGGDLADLIQYYSDWTARGKKEPEK